MKITKIAIFLIIASLLTVFVSSGPSRINILNLEYDFGNINIIEKTSKIGYYPDRINQPDQGHNLSIYSLENENLYSFKFIPPFVEFMDGFEEDKNIGFVDFRNQFKFSLIVPSLHNENRIVILNDKLEVVGEFELKDVKTKNNPYLFIIFLVVILLFLAWSLKFRKKN